MTDRILRDELFESERWLDLPSDTHRLAFIGLLPLADDFGNLEAGQRRLFRKLEGFTQIKSEEALASVLTHLLDADLIRGYGADGRHYYHLPRFRSHRQYLVRKVPASEWDAQVGRELGKSRRVIARGLANIQGLAEKVATTSLPRSNDVAAMSQPYSNDVAEGVGVGVGEVHGAARPSDVKNDDAKKVIFDVGVRLLTDSGMSEKSSRSLLGKLVKGVGETVVLEKLGYLASNKKIEPASYLIQACRVKTPLEIAQEKMKYFP